MTFILLTSSSSSSSWWCLWTLVGLLAATPICADLLLPYEKTPPSIVEAMLTIANVGPDTIFLDLGCGEGDVVRAALNRGAKESIGVDNNPDLIKRALDISKVERKNGGVGGGGGVASFHVDTFDRVALNNVTVAYLYWVPDVINQFAERLFRDMKPGTVIMSHDYRIGDHVPAVEWFSEGFPDKKRINGEGTAFLYKYIVGGGGAARRRRREGEETTGGGGGAGGGAATTLKQSIRGVATFRLTHVMMPSSIKRYTAAYTQHYVSTNPPGLWNGPIHILVEDGKMRALWLRGAAERGTVVHFSVSKLTASPTSTSSGGTGTEVIVSGMNQNQATGEILENLGLRDVPLPVNVTVVLRGIGSAHRRRRGETAGGRPPAAGDPRLDGEL